MKNYWESWVGGKTDEDKSLKRDRVTWAIKYVSKRLGAESPQPSFNSNRKDEEHLKLQIESLSASASGREILEGMRHAWYTKKGRLLKQDDNYRPFTWWLPNSTSGKLNKLSRALDSYASHAEVVAKLIDDADAFKEELTKELKDKNQKKSSGAKKGSPKASFKHRAEQATLRKEIRHLNIRLNNEIFARLRAEAVLLKASASPQELTTEEEQEIIKAAKQERRGLADLIKNISS